MKVYSLITLILLCGLSASQIAGQSPVDKKADLIVAADGSGDVKSVGEAIARVPENNSKRFVIRIKSGVYKEQIRIPASKPFVSLIGDKAETTKLTFDLTNKAAGSTSASYSFYVGGHDFYAENISFENSFGTGSQAVAVLTEADRIFFKNCRFLGWQDTLYAKNGRQYFENCYIEGHVDFIFGQAAAVFENCRIHSKADGYIAAPMRFAVDEPSGFVFNNCQLTGESTVDKGVYLARPWRDYGRTVFLNVKMDAHIRPQGFHHWQPEREKTAYFAEYKSNGAGAKPESRVKWSRQLTESEAKQFSTENFLRGTDNWNPKAANFNISAPNKTDFSPVAWKDVLKQSKNWYAVDEASRIADQVVLYQKENGGWGKNLDMAAMLSQAEKIKLEREKSSGETTIDNSATTTQLAFLAKVITASLAKPTPPNNFEKHKTAFSKGLDFLFAAQYENGGFPQFFPLKQGYYSHITFNDNATINVLRLMRDIVRKKPDFLFVDDARRAKAEKTIEKGIAAILKTQVVIKGEKTVWCAQHDEKTFAPVPARKFEPVSLSGKESAAIIEFLISVENPNQEIIESIEAAIKWFDKSRISGIKVVEKPDKNLPRGFDSIVIADKTASTLWARFYELETNRPIFTGRDGVVKYSLAEIDAERRTGYGWFTEEPNELLNKHYPKWRKSLEKK